MWGAQDLAPCTAASNLAQCRTNHEQYLFGVKEALDPATRRMTFADRTGQKSALIDVTGATVWNNGSVDLPGGGPASSRSYASLTAELLSDSAIGYKRKLDMGTILRPKESHEFEINFTQPKLLALGNGRSLVAFTTYEPKGEASLCGERGNSYLYILDTFTGLPSPALASMFAGDQASANPDEPHMVSGGMFTGNEVTTEATILVGDGVITIGTSSADNSRYEKKLPFGSAPSSAVISWREAMTLGIDPDIEP